MSKPPVHLQLASKYGRHIPRKLHGLAATKETAPLPLKKFLKIHALLFRKNAFTFPLSTLAKHDPVYRKLKVLRAATTPMWPMGTNYWVRDNALIGARLISLWQRDSKVTARFHKLGKELLLSSMTLMSTRSQLSRFRSVIISSSAEHISRAASWPQIFLGIENNLSGETHESWGHKQDAWQILAHSVLSNLERGRIRIEELTNEHREFLSLIVPFLGKVRYFEQPNSGSWEELEAVRTSVVAWDMALLHQIYRMSTGQRYAFLAEGFQKFSGTLNDERAPGNFTDYVRYLLLQGAHVLKRTIPFECPQYPPTDPRHRLADSALIYLLQLKTPTLVADLLNLPSSWVEESEKKLLKTIGTLFDPRTGGYRRYLNDSYQRFGYFRESTVQELAELFGAPSGDAGSGFVGRDRIVPKGPEASWTHFSWQLSAWAGERYRETLEDHYFKLQSRYFQQGLRTILVKPGYSLEQISGNRVKVISIPPFRFTECYLTEEDATGRQFVFPTPHTPLNWATAEALDAFSSMERNLRQRSLP